MKKTLVFVLAVLLVVAFTVPASAFESVFGGYWRTRIFTQKNFSFSRFLPRLICIIDANFISIGKNSCIMHYFKLL